MELEKHYKGSQKSWSRHNPTEGWKKRMRRGPSPLYLLPYTVWGSLSGTNGTYHAGQRPGMALRNRAGPVLGTMLCGRHLNILNNLTRGFTFSFSTRLHKWYRQSFLGNGLSCPLPVTLWLLPFQWFPTSSPGAWTAPLISDTGWFLGPHRTAEWWCPAPDVIIQIISSCDQDLA